MNLSGVKYSRTVQLIGDSSKFTAQGTQFAQKFLKPYLSGNYLIEYGYTGHKEINEAGELELDINSFANTFVDQFPEYANRFIANVVGHTRDAIDKWGCYVSPYIKNFVVVYNDSGMTDENYTKFGDDIIASDHFLNIKDEDMVICLEGGAQSFKQVVNSMKLGLPIKLVLGLRKPYPAQFFSTARFLYQIKIALDKKSNLSEDEAKQIYLNYKNTLKDLWDSKRADAETKKALFEKAIFEFIKEGAYKLVAKNCEFITA